jgi:hypothetical protein
MNICANYRRRVFLRLLYDDGKEVSAVGYALEKEYGESDDWRRLVDSRFDNEGDFPPTIVSGVAP